MNQPSNDVPAVEPIAVTVARAAQILGTSRYRVYQLVKDGAVEARWDDRRYLVSLASLRAYYEALPMRPAAEEEATA